MILSKPKRVSDDSVLARTRLIPCVACGAQPSDPAHIKSRGAGGGDECWNVIPLCRGDHQAQHRMGWVTFARKNWSVFDWLLRHNWEILGGKLIHPMEAHGESSHFSGANY